jgi:SPP1 family predicted phage head-tail adaptor
MKAGSLDQRVTIQAPTSDTDESGQPVDAWVNQFSLWAHIRFGAGLETIKSGAPTSVLKASIRIRACDGITAGMRVMHNGQAYKIESVPPRIARAEFMDLICEVIR